MIARFVVLISMLAALGAPVMAQSNFETRATYAAILDHETGELLYSKGGDVAMAPSSMSKLMTALMVFEALERGELTLETTLPVSEDAWRRGGVSSGSSTMFLEVNSRASVADLLRGIIVQSGNDACIVVAEALGGSEGNFAMMMTERARELGLDSANFTNSTGWPDPEHRISAIDLARLTRHIIAEHPQYFSLYGEEEFTYNGIRQFNRNPLLGLFDGADGMKTGRADDAGYGLTATAERDGVRRIVVFNGMESERDRASEAERLMRAALTEFRVDTIVEAGALVGEAEVYLGQNAIVPLQVIETLDIGGHRRDLDAFTAEVVYDGPLTAPVAAGTVVGRLEVSLPDGRSQSVPLAAAETVERKGALGRAGAALARLIRGG